MTGIRIEMENLDTHTHTGKTPCEDESRDWGDASISQGTPKLARKPPESREASWNRVSLTAIRKNQPCQHVGLEVLASGTVRKLICCV